MSLNPLDHPLVLADPVRLTSETPAWHEHIPFAFWLVAAQRPRLLVELGTHYGDSYCAFCQAVEAEGLDTRAFAVDTWTGDPQAGEYGPEVLADLRAHHDPRYGRFSTLVQSSFDDALGGFEDGTIDLLHIDGLHTYEAVKHDFETWLPKLSDRALVLLHDIAVRERGFGVSRLWEELAARYPAFELGHGHGLGLLGVGEKQEEEVRRLFALPPADAEAAQRLFAVLGARLSLISEERAPLLQQVTESQKHIARLQAELAERELQLALVVDSLTWRAVTPLRRAGSATLDATAYPRRLAERVRDLWHEQGYGWQLLTRWESAEGKAAEEPVAWRSGLTVRNVRKPALLAPPPSVVRFRVNVPSRAVFRAAVALLEPAWAAPVTAQFAVTARRADGSSKTWTKAVDSRRRSHRRWIPFGVHLGDFAGEEIELELATEGGADAPAAWGLPAIVHPKPARDVAEVVTSYFGRHGLREGVRRGFRRLRGEHPGHREQYQLWMAKNDPTRHELERQREAVESLPVRPTISVLTPVHDTDHEILRKAIESVLRQSYPKWELCVVNDGSRDPEVARIIDAYAAKDARLKVRHRPESGGIVEATNDALSLASGEFVALLDHDDELAPHALFRVVEALAERPEADMLYSDEDKIDLQGRRFDPFFKPDWSPDYFRSCMYTCHLGVYRRSLVEELGGFRPGYDGAQDWDLGLRVSERARDIVHIPGVLYHWRVAPGSVAFASGAKPYAYEAARRALGDHLRRLNLPGHLERGPSEGFFRVRYELRATPLVSIAIPTAGRVRKHGGRTFDPLLNCVESIVARSAYDNFEILCVDDGELPKETARGLDALADPRIRRLSFTRPFNFAEKMNFAAEHAGGEHLVFLNDDTEVLSADWLGAMLEFSQQEEVGAVGAKLHFPGGGIQHGGVVLPNGLPGHAFYGFPSRSSGYFRNLEVICNYSAVTAACMMTRKGVFEELGGFDPIFPFNYNDVDYCLRLRERGYRIVFTPYAELRHFESLSRNGQATDTELALLKKKWGTRPDPFYNPNFRQDASDFTLAV